MPFLFVLILCATLAQAEQQMVRVQLEYIETDQSTLKQALDSPAPYPLILGKLKKGEAQRYNTEILTTKEGTNASTEAFLEFLYPVEYTPILLPSHSGHHSKRLLTNSVEARHLNANCWDIRHVGFTLEIQPFISRELIDLRFATEDVALQRLATIQPFKDRWGAADLKFPFFTSKRTNSNLTLAPGQPLLFACYSPLTNSGKPDPSRPILLFVTATILTNS